MPRVSACPDIRTAVLETATQLMERYGYRKMTIEDIASEVGIGKATIYGYYKNKQEIALAVMDEYHARIERKWQTILASDTSPSSRIKEMGLAKVTIATDAARRYRNSLDESLSALRPLVLERRQAWLASEAITLAEVIAQGIELGELEPVEPRLTAKTLLAAISGSLPYSLSSKELANRNSILEQADGILTLLLRGMAKRQNTH